MKHSSLIKIGLNCFLAFTALVGCSTNPTPGTAEAFYNSVQEEEADKLAMEAADMDAFVNNTPSWWRDELPTSQVAVYAQGRGIQRSLALAKIQAMEDAKAGLMEQISADIDRKTQNFLSGSNFEATDDIRAATEARVKGTLVGLKPRLQHEYASNGKVQILVRLEYPLGKANALFLGQIRKDEDALREARKVESFRQLEKMLDN